MSVFRSRTVSVTLVAATATAAALFYRPATPLNPDAAKPDPTSTPRQPPPAQPSPRQPTAVAPDQPQADKAGALDRALQRHFIKRARHCIGAMHDRAPHAQGLLALQMELVADGDGVVVDDFSATDSDALTDSDLLECVTAGRVPVGGLTSTYTFDFKLPVEPRGH
jgi:hypothetical protein